MTDNYVEIISRVCRTCFEGSLPATSDELFVDAVMSALQRTTLDGQPQSVLDNFRDGLREALTDLRLAEAVANNGLVN